MSRPHHRHQDSLEGTIDIFPTPLPETIRRQAEQRFYEVLSNCGDEDPNSRSRYNRPVLVRLVYEHSKELQQDVTEPQDNFLRSFFDAIKLPIDGPSVDISEPETADVRARLFGFADYLVNNFFLPLLASTGKTPQPTPEYRSATLLKQEHSEVFVGTPQRLSLLRGQCLTRDKHRCVITRDYDKDKAREQARGRTFGGVTLDDDGHPVANLSTLEVAHILPHSLVQTDSEFKELAETRKSALEILNMFDKKAAPLINGVDVDRPRNALTLTVEMHRDFGRFDIYFTPITEGNSPPNTYRIESFLPALHPMLPVTRTLQLTANRTTEPPNPHLLAIHRAIGHILHLSAAGQYIDNILQSWEEQRARSDGSTQLGELVTLGLLKLMTIR